MGSAMEVWSSDDSRIDNCAYTLTPGFRSVRVLAPTTALATRS
jgi:hypothetical protein